MELEHDCQLNEGIIRVLLLRKDNLTEEEMNAPTPAMLETTTREHETAPRSEGKEESDDEDADDTQGDTEEEDESSEDVLEEEAVE